jgi:predicted component of type VI protein secretion system
MAQNETTLTTALQAAHARTQQRISTNPSALSEGLVRQQELPDIDFAVETATALETLETAVVEYQDREGRPNLPLIEAKQAVALLEAQLTEARARLKELESKGTWLDHFNAAVHAAERRVEGLVGQYERRVTDELLRERFGQTVSIGSLSKDTRRELQLHIRITNLKRFYIGRRGDFDVLTPEYLYARAEKAAKTLDALRKYIEQDQAEHNAKT